MRDALDDLVAKSMIVLDDGPDGTTRYRLLETLRQYALERLDDVGRTEEHRRRHAEHYATFAEAAGPGLEGPDEAAWFPRFDAELDNLRAAVAWALDADNPSDGELGLRIIAPLAIQTFLRPSAGVGEWAETAVARAETSTPGRRTAVLGAAAWKASLGGNSDLTQLRASAALRDEHPPDTPSLWFVYAALSGDQSVVGAHQAALQTVAAGERALHAVDADDYARLWLRNNAVLIHLRAGQYEEARAASEDALGRVRALTNPSLLIASLRFFAWTRRPDESNDAIAALEECLTHARRVATPDSPNVVQALGQLAHLRAHRGERVPAIQALREGVVRGHDTGQVIMVAYALGHGTSVAADLEAWEFAATLGSAVADGPLARYSFVSPVERADQLAVLDRARVRLGPDRHDAAHAAGIAMTYEELVAYTLAELDRLMAGADDG